MEQPLGNASTMDSLETPYEEDLEFIQCTVCARSLKGESLFKIHVTSPSHLKKVQAGVALGRAVPQETVPKFTDIVQYLDYVQLDEPIIGLGCLEEVPNPDPHLGPKFMCKLCKHSAILTDMVCHVIGRKHRQKYVEAKRPDLVTWDYRILNTQAGRIMRAKAEIIERQDGRGHPQAMQTTEVEKLNTTRIPPRQGQYKEQSIPHQPTSDVPPVLPELTDFHSRKRSWDYQNTPGLHSDANVNRELLFPREALSSQHRPQDEFQRAASLSKYREGSMNPDYHQDPQRRSSVERRDRPVYDNRDVYGQDRTSQSEAAASYKRLYPNREGFYTEEVRRGNGLHEYQTPQQGYSGGDQRRWSLERESVPPDRAFRQGSSEPEAKRRNVPGALGGDGCNKQLFNIIKDYHHKMRYSHQERSFDQPGPSREEPSNAQMKIGNISNIPEPFMRFLKGGVKDEMLAGRKSRFSDATQQEMEMTNKMFRSESPYSDAREDSRPMRAGHRGAQYSGNYEESQPYHREGYDKGGSESGSFFDMLKNVEIQNSEEAAFLKNKLYSLVKEFQAKKNEKNMASREHERNPRESFDRTRLEDPPFDNDHRRGWNQREQRPEEHYQAYGYPAREEPRQSGRTRYEDEMGSYPERFQEPMRPAEYQPGGVEVSSSAPPLFMEQENRRLGDSSYPKNLNRITSALLELVARK